MPIYEYEPLNRDCLICSGRVEALQPIDAAALKYCPTCGLEVRRIVSHANIAIRKGVTPESAARKGFTTFKKVEAGKWEKTAGEGPDMIVGQKADVDAVKAEAKPAKKIIQLDD